MQEELQDRPGVVAPPPFLFLGGLIISVFLHMRYPVPLFPGKASKVPGLALIAIAIALFVTALRTMRQAGTNVNPTMPATAVVVTGPYRFTRNPIYFAFSILYTGITFAVNTLWGIVTLPFVLLLINRGVIDREERYLERKFGAQYRQYKERVHRWF